MPGNPHIDFRLACDLKDWSYPHGFRLRVKLLLRWFAFACLAAVQRTGSE
jgi:hypothetical protein